MAFLSFRPKVFWAASAALLISLAPACRAESSDMTGREIFVIGDSLTTGYGALGAGPDCKATAETNSPEAAYAAVLARQLGATLVVDAVSGRGLVHNVTGQDAPTAKASLLDIPNIRAGMYSDLKPALVLVHIGTNDHYQNDPGPAFEDAYQDLLEAIADTYPDARIVGLFGPALHGEDAARATGAIKRAIASASASRKRKIGFVQLAYSKDPDDAIGCDWHPGTGTHAAMAQTIADYLTEEAAP